MVRRRLIGGDLRMCMAFVCLSVLLIVNGPVEAYKIGVGRADCTGPSVEVIFMGYAQLSQKGEGIHLRQFSRAFIIEDEQENRVAFVSFDAGMVGNAVKRAVIKKLKERYGAMYTTENVIVSGTHTHSAPGGFLTHLLYDLSTLGFVSETFNAYVDGIYNSIVRAHDHMEDGRLFIAETEIHDANINRSPNAYMNNPKEERDRFKDDVDKQLVQLRFVATKSKRLMGVINWFAVHPTSMNNTNRLVSSDNVGYASVLLEQEYNPEKMVGKGDFVGAFASTNLGDVSPNIMGSKCQLSGDPCDLNTSSCPEGKGPCVASGPGKDMFESTKIIATRIYKGASKLLRNPESGVEIKGPVKFIHQYVNMTHAVQVLYNSQARSSSPDNVIGCRPAMGYSFAAGTTDGPGAFQFTQGTTSDNPLWNAIRDFIAEPSPEDKKCQFPKPILLASGRAVFPYEWQPKIVSTQMFKIGNVILAAVPGEFTTMSGRRLRTVVRNSALQTTGEDVKVIVVGLANMYTSYITTPEEYEVQRYEGASTIFGPHTLTLYLEEYAKLTQSMINDENVEPGPEPPHLEDGTLMSLQPGVVFDGHPFGSHFGEVRTQPRGSYHCGEVLKVRFQTANPRNNRMHEKSFFTVERQLENGEFKVVATDANWETKFFWSRTSLIWGHSEMRFQWDIPETCVPGVYRIKHYGQARYLLGGYSNFEGTTNKFKVVG